MLPIKGPNYITQEYGLSPYARSSKGKAAYKNFPGGIHPGVDYGTKGVNYPVLATCDGKIVRALSDGGWGNHIELWGADGWNRQYAHLSSIKVGVGEAVKIGDELGRVGSTGISTGVHLHYGHRRKKAMGGWEYRDPSITNDLKDTPVIQSKVITKHLIKGTGQPEIFIYNGRSKFYIPDMETLNFLFGERFSVEEVELDVISKVPEGSSIPSLK